MIIRFFFTESSQLFCLKVLLVARLVSQKKLETAAFNCIEVNMLAVF